MNINTSYEHSFVEQTRRDVKEREEKVASKLESYEDSKAEFPKGNAAIAKGADISGKNEAQLSKKAQDFLKGLREKYGDYDFMIGNSSDDLKALSNAGSKEFSVIFSSAEIEKMANDEKYADEKMKSVEGAVNMAKRIAEENGFVKKVGVIIDDDGNMKMFAELEKASSKQRERIEANREKHAEEKKAADKAKKKNPYEKDEKTSVKRTRIEADSEEELIAKLKNIDWDKIADSHSGDRVDFSI